jgi:DNA repair exonuclease SbcCD ATPase subunit
VIIEMHVVLGSDNIERAVASIGASAASLGGGIASSDIDYPSATTGATGHAVLVVKVPPAGVNGLLDGLNATGTVQSIDQIAQDVSDQLVDLEVRIANARQSVSNVRQFMEQTQNLNELVTLESELTRRQTELEQLEAQQRNLRDRVAFSTITIEVVPLASLPELESDDDMSIGEAFESGWDAFAATFVAIAFVLAVLAPFAAVALVFGLVAWRVSRRLDRPNRPRTHHDVRRELEDADQRDRDRERQPVGVSTQSDDEPSG